MRENPTSTRPKTRSGIIGKTLPLIQDEPAPSVFALHLDAAKNNGESRSRTWVTRFTKPFSNHLIFDFEATHLSIKNIDVNTITSYSV
ncbi:hypothetical protein Hanom_Chr01g00091991 [Helianthus anomalus]